MVIVAYLGLPFQIMEKYRKLTIRMSETVIAFEKVSKTYAGVNALDDIDLEIGHGTRVAVMGQSGSGKSTLLNLMCGLDVPTSGKVVFEGRDLSAMSDDDRTRLRRKKIGMIFQTFNLMPTLNCIENVALPLRLNGLGTKDADKRAGTVLERVGLTGRLDHRPDEMSGGERQRVAIARALVFDPSVLLADEPTGNLDSATGQDILNLLDDVHSEFGMTVILVTHNEQAAATCERRIEMLDGRIVNDSSRADLTSSP